MEFEYSISHAHSSPPRTCILLYSIEHMERIIHAQDTSYVEHLLLDWRNSTLKRYFIYIRTIRNLLRPIYTPIVHSHPTENPVMWIWTISGDPCQRCFFISDDKLNSMGIKNPQAHIICTICIWWYLLHWATVREWNKWMNECVHEIKANSPSQIWTRKGPIVYWMVGWGGGRRGLEDEGGFGW